MTIKKKDYINVKIPILEIRYFTDIILTLT